jgi:hypothetical protein
MKPTLLFISALGLILFGSVFLFTYNTPKVVEIAAQDFVKYKVKEEIKELIGSEKMQRRLSLFCKMSKKLGSTTNKDSVLQKIEGEFSNIVEVIYLSYIKKEVETISQISNFQYIDKIKFNKSSLKTFATKKYHSISQNLRNDIRIFSGCNSVLFLFLLILSFTRPKTLKVLFLPAMLLLLATVLSTLIYIFGQNWIYVLLSDSYMGYGYLIYIAVIFFFLCDIAFLEGRFTAFVLELILNSLSSLLAYLPI